VGDLKLVSKKLLSGSFDFAFKNKNKIIQ
jgi:hypothetical protein